MNAIHSEYSSTDSMGGSYTDYQGETTQQTGTQATTATESSTKGTEATTAAPTTAAPTTAAPTPAAPTTAAQQTGNSIPVIFVYKKILQKKRLRHKTKSLSIYYIFFFSRYSLIRSVGFNRSLIDAS